MCDIDKVVELLQEKSIEISLQTEDVIIIYNKNKSTVIRPLEHNMLSMTVFLDSKDHKFYEFVTLEQISSILKEWID